MFVKLILYYTTSKHTYFIRKDSKCTSWPDCPYASRVFAVWDKLWFSDKPLRQFKSLPLVSFKIQPWLSCRFLKYANKYCHAWGAGKPSAWMARLQPESGRHAAPAVGVLSEPCVDYWEIVKIILKKNLKCLHFREIWPYGFDWSIISSFKSSDQIIELINDFPWFYMCWHELSLSAAY